VSTDAINGSGKTGAFDASTGITKPADKLAADKGTFLKLLVSQLKYQNPLNPADGTQFVTQLAQFTTLEQSTQMGEDLAAIRAVLEQQNPATTA
jgi:flagellar basal-body rod modification protein FlgD